MIQASSVLHHQREDLLLGYASDFQALLAASFAAQNSNSRPGCFQKLRQEFHQRLVRAVLNRQFRASKLLARNGMAPRQQHSGFTIVELLVTMFIAVALFFVGHLATPCS